MLALLLIARIDDVFGVQISAADFADIRTIADLYDHVKQQLAV
jgi:acyl carrier protein